MLVCAALHVAEMIRVAFIGYIRQLEPHIHAVQCDDFISILAGVKVPGTDTVPTCLLVLLLQWPPKRYSENVWM